MQKNTFQNFIFLVLNYMYFDALLRSNITLQNKNTTDFGKKWDFSLFLDSADDFVLKVSF